MGLPLRHGVLPGSVAHVAAAHVMPIVEPPTSEGAGTSSSSTTAGAEESHRSSPGAAAGARRQGGAGYEEQQEKVLRASLLHVVAIRTPLLQIYFHFCVS